MTGMPFDATSKDLLESDAGTRLHDIEPESGHAGEAPEKPSDPVRSWNLSRARVD